MTFQQFQNWYNSTHEEELGEDEDGEEYKDEDTTMSTMENLRRVTGLGAFNVQDVMDIFVSSQNETKELTKTEFVNTLRRIIDTAETNSTEKEIVSALHRLFNIFDTNHDGVVDATELYCGLTVIVGGSARDKSQVAFNLIDTNHDNSISIQELETYLKSVFSVMLLTGSDLDGRSPEDLADETARECFEFNNVSSDEGVSLAQSQKVVRSVRARSARISLFLFTYSEVSPVSLCYPHSQQYHSNGIRKYVTRARTQVRGGRRGQ